jgi:gliding motility-associated-like protein
MAFICYMFGTQKYGRQSFFWLLMMTFIMCSLESRSQGDLPDIPDLIRVTVEHDISGVLIQWEPSEDTDIKFYHLYKMNDQQSFELIQSFSPDTLEYIHMTSLLNNLTYSVTAEDSSDNESLFGQNIHRAVSLSLEFDPCTPSNLITWKPYLGWEGKISGYYIYGGTDSDSLNQLDFVSHTTLSYPHEEVVPGSYYYYYIETLNIDNDTSLSAIDSVAAIYPEAPAYITVDYVSVVDPNGIELQFTADVSGPVKNFRLMKRSNIGTPYTEVSTFWDESQSTHVVQDQFPTGTESYQYMVQSIYQPPACSTPILLSESNTGNNILLGNSVENLVVTLSWNPYENYTSGLAEYLIQRRFGDGEFSDVQSLSSGTTRWSESLEPVINGSQPGVLQYRVVAVSSQPGLGNPGVSISNITTVTVETQMEIPNAFTPGTNDINAVFKPQFDFAPKDYLLMVMDRGGRKMFETYNPSEGWDGRFLNGEFVNEGVYVYFIQYTDYTGLFTNHTGNVTVLYP